MVSEPARAEQPLLFRRGRQEIDVAVGTRPGSKTLGHLDQHRDPARIVDRAVADAVGSAFGPADAEMVPMAEEQHRLAVGLRARQLGDDIVARKAAHRRGRSEIARHRQQRAAIVARPGRRTQRLAALSRLGEHGIERRRRDIAADLRSCRRRPHAHALRAQALANLVPRHRIRRDDQYAHRPRVGEHLAPLAVTRQLVAEGRRIEQHDRDLARDIGVDPARRIDAIANEDERRIGQRHRRLAAGDDDPVIADREGLVGHLEARASARRLRFDERNRL